MIDRALQILLARWNAEITRARREYDLTRLDADNLCVACQTKPREGTRFMCWKCRRAEKKEVA